MLFQQIYEIASKGGHMKSYLAILCVACAMLSPSPGQTSQLGDIYVRFLEGDVQVRTQDVDEWLPASINMPLMDGDQIWVPDNARAELMLRDGAILRLDRSTYAEILPSENEEHRFYLDRGCVYGNTIFGNRNAVIIETLAVSFRARSQALFGIDISGDRNSTIRVFHGEVYADNGARETKIGAPTRWSLTMTPRIHEPPGLPSQTNGYNGTGKEIGNSAALRQDESQSTFPLKLTCTLRIFRETASGCTTGNTAMSGHRQ